MGIIRGIVVTAFFGIVLWVLIPVYVPRPGFVPGFTPPPDMWPRAVSISGVMLGTLLVALSLSKKTKKVVDPESASSIRSDTLMTTLVVRFISAVASFVLFVGLVYLVGFWLSSVILLVGTLGMTGFWHNKWITAIVGLTLPTVLYLFFSNVLNSRFPAGVLFRAMGF